MLNEFDKIVPSNESTSLLSFSESIGRKKARVVSDWLEKIGFTTLLEERRFGPSINRSSDEPGVALCGVDNELARANLEKAGFGLVVEAGLGAGPEAFRNFALHTFPASRSAEEIWSQQVGQTLPLTEQMPAYQVLKRRGVDGCGLTRLANRSSSIRGAYGRLPCGFRTSPQIEWRAGDGIGLWIYTGSRRYRVDTNGS